MDDDVVDVHARDRAEILKLRQTVREQGEFIQSMREMIADFVYGQTRASLGRHLNG